ncbi:hypothetical protein I4U23_011448 [Adineta vaga]|nr:hypothetical protein I4U23_011448 [Adineta vaga]
MLAAKERRDRRRKMYQLCISATFGLIIVSCTVYLNILPSYDYVLINLSSLHRNIRFTPETIYLLYNTAYDFYSMDEIISRSGPRSQWKAFSFPNESLPANITPWEPIYNIQKENRSFNIPTSSITTTGLAFVDHIYIISDSRLTDRRAYLKRSLNQYNITNYEWRMKWTYASCRDPKNKEDIYRKLNLKKWGNPTRQRRCSIAMQHVDIWHDIVTRNSSLSLIFEDDAIFVPYFREKFDRTIYTAIRTGMLKMGGLNQCIKDRPPLSKNSNEWVEQDPMIFIGGCFHLHDPSFPINRKDAPPMFSTHKGKSTRCNHAYLLTACSAKAILDQLNAEKNRLFPLDLMLNFHVAVSPKIQSFWIDQLEAFKPKPNSKSEKNKPKGGHAKEEKRAAEKAKKEAKAGAGPISFGTKK